MTDFSLRYYFFVRADMSGLIIGVRIRFQYLSWGCGNRFFFGDEKDPLGDY